MYDIIMPIGSYNSILEIAIKTAVNQVLPYEKFIFVIDTKSNEEYEKCINLTSKIDRSISLRTNRVGAGKARQIGIENSMSKYIAFLDSDDLWHHMKMKIQIEKLESEKTEFSFTSYRKIKGSNQKILCNTYCNNEISIFDLFISCPIAHSSVVCRRDIFNDRIKFSEIKRRCDYATWLKIFKNKKPRQSIIPDYLVLITQRSGSISSEYWSSPIGFISIVRAYQSVGINYFLSVISGIFFSSCQIFVKLKRKLKFLKPINSPNVEDYKYSTYFD